MSSPPTSSSSGPSRRERIRLLVAGGAAVLMLVFALFNLGRVRVDWIFGDFHTPLIIVILSAFALGLGAGLLIARRRA